MPHTSIKGQVLTDLVVEFIESPLEEEVEKRDMDGKSVGMVSLQEPLSWRVYVDGVANQRGSRVGLVVISPEKIIIEKSLRLVVGQVKGELEARDVRMQNYLKQVRHL